MWLSQVIKPSAHPNPMPSKYKWSLKCYNIQVQESSCGDLLESYDGLQFIWVEAC
jgi:hypothetical protein